MLMLKWALRWPRKAENNRLCPKSRDRNADEKEREGVGEAPPPRYDYEIFLDYDPSGTISGNLVESLQNVLLLTNRSNLSEPTR